MPEVYKHEMNGLVMVLGTSVRPRDPDEDKYHLMRVMAPGQADLNTPMLLADLSGNDYRIPITDQGQLGACAAFSTREAAQMARRLTGQADLDLHAGWIYEKVRLFEKSFPQDAGSFPADNLDIAIKGAPKLSLYAYQQNAGFQYPASMDGDAPNQAWVGSHHPYYPTDGNFVENIWLAIQARMPTILSMYWTNAFFTPVNGALPEGQTQAQQVGGHAITAWGVVPGFVLCANHWTTGWNTAAPSMGFKMRPGDFAIPWSYFRDTSSNSMIFEARAVSGVAIAPNPQPTPGTCKDSVLAVTSPIVSQLQAQFQAKPSSLTYRYKLQGAQAVQNALQAANL